MKIGISVAMHWSDQLRPNGEVFIKNLVNSINDSVLFDKSIYVIDNASQYETNIIGYPNVKYFKIQDQSIEGITGAWNQGIYNAIKDGCDVIINTNDDLIFNNTVNKFVEYIINDKDNINTVYGPVTNGVLVEQQFSNKHSEGVLSTKSIGGFMFGFTKEHYHKFKFNDYCYFNKNNKYNGGDGIWGGQEGQFIENLEKGCLLKITKFCWVDHNKQRGWKNAKRIYTI
jgi:GT2 family glycosyltransferase